MVRSSVALIGLVLTSVLPHPMLGSSVRPAAAPTEAPNASSSDYRASVIARAKVWQPTDVATMDLKTGPSAPKAFALNETVTCTYVKEKLGGKTPKFACKTDENDQLKVKFGGDNGEVYAEVMASRLLWAIGFGADHMYPVRVVCRHCPSLLNGVIRSSKESIFDPATIERKMPGEAFKPDEGWSWKELDLIDEKAGGATRAERDALRLLAVFIQHTDTKPEQQRLLCLGETKQDHAGKGPMPCTRPFMLIQDLGVTFGHANKFNENAPGSANLAAWSKTPVWHDENSCVANLPKSATGTLENPPIGEAGRRFLAGLLTQLTDTQLHDLFEAARVTLRLRDPESVTSGFATIDEWVAAFKQKRSQIVDRHCATS
jgi:hypothetical protein